MSASAEANVAVGTTSTPMDKAQTNKPVLNVWGVKGPLAAGKEFVVQARVKCFGGESLEGACIKVVDPTTGKVLGSSRTGTEQDTAAGILQDQISLQAPTQEGLHRWVVLVEGKSQTEGSVPVQKPLAFSTVGQGDLPVTVTCVDDKSGAPVPDVTLFFYDQTLKKTGPLQAVAGKDGMAKVNLVAGRPYRIQGVAEDYATNHVDIIASEGGQNVSLPMRSVFNIKMKKVFF